MNEKIKVKLEQIELLKDRILVHVPPKNTKTKGGILLASNTEDDSKYKWVKVLKTGKEYQVPGLEMRPMDIKEDDEIYIFKNAGVLAEFEIEGIEEGTFRIVTRDEVIILKK